MASSLSPQERMVLTLTAQGQDDKGIGRALGLTQNTLRTYWHRIRTKLGDETRARLTVLALQSGEIRVEGLTAEERRVA